MTGTIKQKAVFIGQQSGPNPLNHLFRHTSFKTFERLCCPLMLSPQFPKLAYEQDGPLSLIVQTGTLENEM